MRVAGVSSTGQRDLGQKHARRQKEAERRSYLGLAAESFGFSACTRLVSSIRERGQELSTLEVETGDKRRVSVGWSETQNASQRTHGYQPDEDDSALKHLQHKKKIECRRETSCRQDGSATANEKKKKRKEKTTFAPGPPSRQPLL